MRGFNIVGPPFSHKWLAIKYYFEKGKPDSMPHFLGGDSKKGAFSWGIKHLQVNLEQESTLYLMLGLIFNTFSGIFT